MFDTDKRALWTRDFFARIGGKERRCHEEHSVYLEELDAWLMVFSYPNYLDSGKTYWICLYDGHLLRKVPSQAEKCADEMREDLSWIRENDPNSIRFLLFPAHMRFASDEYMQLSDTMLDRKSWGLHFILGLQMPWLHFIAPMILIFLISAFCLREYVSGSFYLFGRLFDNRSAMILFYSWAIPLLTLNAILNQQERDTVSMIALGLLPVSLRIITLFRNTHPVNAWIAYAIIGIAAAAEGALCLSGKHSIGHTLECARNTAAKIAALIAVFFLILQTLFPASDWIVL